MNEKTPNNDSQLNAKERMAVGACLLWTLFVFWAILSLCGCMRIITVERTDAGYEMGYYNVGLKTDVSKIEIEKMTNGYVRITVDGVETDVSSENKEIVSSGGTAVGNVAQKVVDGVKGVETIKTNVK